jgi:ATP-dependent DNA ligase
MIRCEPPSVVEKAQLAGRVVPSESLHAVRLQGLEGFMGKRKDSLYGAGKRSGPSIQYRLNRGQELVIDGYIPGTHGLDSMVVGCLAPVASFLENKGGRGISFALYGENPSDECGDDV